MISQQAEKKPSNEECDDDDNRNVDRDDDNNNDNDESDDDSNCRVDKTNPRVNRNGEEYKFNLHKENAKCRSSRNEKVNKLLCCWCFVKFTIFKRPYLSKCCSLNSQYSTNTVNTTASILSPSVPINASKRDLLTFLMMPSKGMIGTVRTISASVSTRRDILVQGSTSLIALILMVSERAPLASQRIKIIGTVPNFPKQERISWMFKSVAVH